MRLLPYHAGQYYSAGQFYQHCSILGRQLQAQPFQHYALYTEDAYPFTVLLFRYCMPVNKSGYPAIIAPAPPSIIARLSIAGIGKKACVSITVWMRRTIPVDPYHR